MGVQSGSVLEDGRILSPQKPAVGQSIIIKSFLFSDQSLYDEIVKAYLKLAPVVWHSFCSFQYHLFSRDQSTHFEKSV